MAVHACLALGNGAPMPDYDLALLAGNFSRLEIVAVAAFSTMIRFHVGPNSFRQRQSLSIEFRTGIDGTRKMMIEHRDRAQVLEGLIGKIPRNMAVGTAYPVAGGAVMLRLFKFWPHIVIHFVARYTKCLHRFVFSQGRPRCRRGRQKTGDDDGTDSGHGQRCSYFSGADSHSRHIVSSFSYRMNVAF